MIHLIDYVMFFLFLELINNNKNGEKWRTRMAVLPAGAEVVPRRRPPACNDVASYCCKSLSQWLSFSIKLSLVTKVSFVY